MIISIAPMNKPRTLPLSIILRLNQSLNKTILNKKFYSEVNSKILTKASTIDANLYFICYFTLLVSSVLNNKTRIRKFLQDQRLKLVALIEKTFGVKVSESNNKLLNKIGTKHPIVESTSNLAPYLKRISSYLSDVRIFNRLFDTVKYMPWIIGEYEAFISKTSKVSKFTRFINLFQAFNCILLEALENLGWLTEHNWIGTNDNNYWCIETYIWCSRVWGFYIIIEVLELFRRTPYKNWDKAWKIELFKQVVQIPLVVHWSLYDGCLTPFWVGICGSGASWWGFKDSWKSLDL